MSVSEKAAERLPRGDAEQLLLAIQAFVRVERRLTDTHSDLATTLDGGCVEEYMDTLAEVGRLMREAKTTRVIGAALTAACDPSLGLGRLVRLGDVESAVARFYYRWMMDSDYAEFPWDAESIPSNETKDEAERFAADFIEREFGAGTKENE